MKSTNTLFSDYFFYQITYIEVQVKVLTKSNVDINNLFLKV